MAPGDSDLPERPRTGPSGGARHASNRPLPPEVYTRRRVLVGLGGAALVGMGVVGWKSLTGDDSKSSASGSNAGGAKATPRPTGPKQVQPPALDGAPAQPAAGHQYDTVIAKGRVIDPDSGFDKVAYVGVDGPMVTAISTEPLQGKATIDATNLVVAPGFIDLLSYEPDDYGARYKLADGVTTNLGMHGLNYPAADFLSRYTDNCMVHFGGALRHPSRREDLCGLNAGQSPSPDQISQQVDDLHTQIQNGWFGVDFEPEYAPGTTLEEMVALGKVAKEYDVVCTFHGRYSSFDKELSTIDEILQVAEQTGARCHVEHVVSTGGTWHTSEALAKIEGARNQGFDVTACLYPYNYWATYLGSARFDDGWQQRFQIGYGDLEIAGTGQRLDPSSFQELRGENKLAVAYAIPEQSVVTGLKDPTTMIGSDAILTEGNNNHPRSTGCFSRVLGRYSRDQKVLDLPSALAKMTILPARKFERKAPALKKKGRLARGADADITVFDPATIIDQSTVENPAIEAKGVQWVLVMGQQARTPDGTQNIHAGQPIKSVV